MRIPLPKLMRFYRDQAFSEKISPLRERWAMRAWAALAGRPWLYRLASEAAVRILGNAGWRRGAFKYLPFASGWLAGRDLPAPQGRTFHSLWREKSISLARSG